jgi:hypothetical protein
MKSHEQKENEPAMSLFGATVTKNEMRNMQKEPDRDDPKTIYRNMGASVTKNEMRNMRKGKR